MKTIREATQIIGMLERGDAAHALSEEITNAIQHLQDAAGPKGKAKGKVALTLSFEVQGQSVEVEADISSKLPKFKRSSSLFFVTAKGELTLEHPTQQDMFPREVEGKPQSA